MRGALLIAAGLLAASCGGDGSSNPPAPTSEPPRADDTTTDDTTTDDTTRESASEPDPTTPDDTGVPQLASVVDIPTRSRSTSPGTVLPTPWSRGRRQMRFTWRGSIPTRSSSEIPWSSAAT